MASSKPLDLEITVISAKHLKNVNWRNGDLKPYATFYLDNSDHRLATRADDSLSTSPVWNERFTLPLTRPLHNSVLTLEIFHSKPSETPKPLVGTAKFLLSDLDSDEPSNSVYTMALLRPSGRPQGKVRVKLDLMERPLPSPVVQDYHTAPNYSHYYNPAPPPPPPPPGRDYREYPPSPYDQYGYYSAYYPPQPPLPSRPLYNRVPSYSFLGGPSAPVDSSPYDHKLQQPGLLQKPSNYGVPNGPSAPVDYSYAKGSGAEISGAMGGLSLEEGNKYEKEKVSDKESQGYWEYQR